MDHGSVLGIKHPWSKYKTNTWTSKYGKQTE